MDQFDHSSILRGVRVTDSHSIRRIMNGVMYRLNALNSDRAAELAHLTGSEQALVDNIYRASRDNPLMDQMASRFASTRNASTRVILEWAQEFDRAAIQAVQERASRPAREYQLAEDTFWRMVDEGAFIHRPDGWNEHGDIDEDSEFEADDPVVVNDNAAQVAGNAVGLAGDGDASRRIYDPNDKSKHAPKRAPGTRCVDEGNHDRTVAKLNNPDPTKLKIRFRLEAPSPTTPGLWIPAGSAEWTYGQPINWSDKKSVASLNNWRQCQFNRQIGPANPPREIWLESERNRLGDILQRHLTTAAVGGRWSRIDWNLVANEYNNGHEGSIQHAGQKSAIRSYSVKSGRALSASRPLKEDRLAPNRTVQGCRNQMEQFVDPRTQTIVRDAKRADEDLSDSDGDDNSKKPKKGKQNQSPKKSKKGKEKAADPLSDNDDSNTGETEQERHDREVQATLERSRRDLKRKERDDDDEPSHSAPHSGPSS